MNYAKVVSETVKFNFWDLISMTSPLPWKQLALILLLGGGVITPSLRFLLHRIRKLCQDLSFCNIWKYMLGCTIAHLYDECTVHRILKAAIHKEIIIVAGSNFQQHFIVYGTMFL